MGIGYKIREFREREGLTQEELAQRLQVTTSAVGNYERGLSHPKEEVLLRLFDALHCEPNELFADYFTPSDDKGHMIKYQSLDSHGRKLVDACTELEYGRVTATALRRSESGADNATVLIAARGGGVPQRMKMVKRKGMGSIKDAPTYKGVR